MKTYFFERTFNFKLKGLSVLLPLVMLVFLSFTPSVEGRLNKYQTNGKIILSSSLGKEVTYDYILYTDSTGVYLDNLDNTIQLLSYEKSYWVRIITPIISCNQSGVKFNESIYKFKFDSQFLKRNNYKVYPIGDWATVLTANTNNPEIPDMLLLNNSDTIYTTEQQIVWNSRYEVKYPSNSEDGEESESIEEPVVAVEENEDITINEYVNISFVSYGDDVDHCLINYCDQEEIYQWAKSKSYTFYKAVVKINQNNKNNYIDEKSVDFIIFDKLDYISFTREEIGSSKMYNLISSKISYKYDLYQAEIENRIRQKILDQCISINQVARDLRNSVSAEKKYSNQKILFKSQITRISQLDPYYSDYKYRVDAIRLNEYTDDEFYSIEIRIYTNDELFTEINYPCNCVVMGTLDVPSCINSSIICFNDGKLILY